MEVPENVQTGSILDTDAFHLAGRILDAVPGLPAFEDFGPYRIEKQIGRGGMGEVYLAWEESANHYVAIKFLRRRWAEPDLPERFAREIKTLGKLEHPFIARLYDMGVHPDGTPYFAMEYVKGKPLDEHCRELHYSVGERLRLFRLVCQAVQYAHSHLVVHRDLKPSNILVRDDGTPKLLDFGIARQLESFDEAAKQTQTQLRFTRAFAAPEQLRGDPIGVYTDVYALGVILYELLAGRPPWDLEGLSPVEAETLIVGPREPEKPSVVASRNNGHISRLDKAAWRDLDQLCLKAVKKSANERYASALELTQDTDRFLNGEPLKARPDTWRYRAGKFVGRNRRSIVTVSLVFALIVGLTSFFTQRLANARDQALAETARSLRVERFMLSLFDSGDKEAGPAGNLTAVTLLDRGTQEVRSLNNEPVVQADLYQTLGGMYQKLGKLDRAEPLLQSALERRKTAFGPDHAEVADTLLALGVLRIDQARLGDAEQLIRDAIAMNQRRLPPDDPAAVNATAALGRVLKERGQYEKAIEVLNQVVRDQSGAGGSKSDLAASLIDLADAHFYLGHYAVSDSLNKQALALHREIHGETYPLVAQDLINLANNQFQWGHYHEAELYDRRALAISQAWYGNDHPETARDKTYLAEALTWQSQYTESAKLLETALATFEQAYGKVHPKVALVLNGLGEIAGYQGHLDEAVAYQSRSAEIYRKIYGDRHWMTAIALSNVATNYLKEGQYARAEAMFRDVIERFTIAQSAGHLNTGVARIKLGRTLLREKRYREAESQTRAGYEIIVKQTSPSVDFVVQARKDLVKEYTALGEPAKAAEFQAEAAVPAAVPGTGKTALARK